MLQIRSNGFQVGIVELLHRMLNRFRHRTCRHAFAGNGSMLNDPTNMINALLNGASAPHTADSQTAAGMPSFDWKMNDQ
ncbi:hypothetical protein ACC771_19015, partial [Rhizobium ruizarguesonis]